MFILSLPCLILGVALASLALKRPEQQAAIETAAGSLLILGLVAIGFCLPCFGKPAHWQTH